MNKSYIEQVANMLGVEFNEEFKIKPTKTGEIYGCKEYDTVFKFCHELLYKGYNDGWSEWYGCDGNILYHLLLGKYEVVKL